MQSNKDEVKSFGFESTNSSQEQLIDSLRIDPKIKSSVCETNDTTPSPAKVLIKECFNQYI